MKSIKRFYNYYFSTDRNFVRSLANVLGFVPANLILYKLAFSHKSHGQADYYAMQNNERLEYLGDAVLGTIVAEYLFRKYPNRTEGFLTKMRSKIVKRKALNKIADRMELDVFLKQEGLEKLSHSMLGNALEALIGAVYLDTDYRRTREFIIFKILRLYLNIQELENYDDNYKSQLLEWCQKNGRTISYQVESKYKQDNRDRFQVAVLIDNKKIADAEEFSKKSAEQLASQKAIDLVIRDE